MRALLVDLDGTLVDTQTANLGAYRRAIAETGLSYFEDELESTVGRLAWRPMLQRVMPDHVGAHRRIAERKREIYPEMMGEVRVNEHLVATLGLLRRSVSTALVTSASRNSVVTVLTAKGLTPLFDLVVTSEDCERHKPSPEPFQFAADRLGVAPCDCVILEDSAVGLAAASAFGAQSWQVHWL